MGAHFWPKYKIKEDDPLNIVELSQKKLCVQKANLGKAAKSYRSDQGKYFLKINQNYFAHICPDSEYVFRVNVI